ncbi:MAG: ABC transporter permease [Acidobacteriota bacterium]
MTRHMLRIVWNRKASNALIILEILVSFLVIFAVATAAITTWRNYHRPLGYTWEDVWHVSLRTGASKLEGERLTAANQTVARLLRELETLEPVQRAAAAHFPPYTQSSSTRNWTTSDNGLMRTEIIRASPEVFEVLGIPLVAGRGFEAADAALAWQPVVVNRSFVRDHFGVSAQEAVGQALDFGGDDNGRPEKRVVGVIDDYRKGGELAVPNNMMFEPAWLEEEQRPMTQLAIKLAPGTTAAFEEELLKRLQAVAPEWSFNVRALASKRATYLRLRLAPLVAAGTVATFLILMVGLGLVGVLWQNVTQRTLEVGLRRAKGATRPNIHWQILGEMLMIASLGLVLGALVIVQVPLMGWFRFLDVATYGFAFSISAVAIYALAAICGLYPSWLAARIQPAEALHYE